MEDLSRQAMGEIGAGEQAIQQQQLVAQQNAMQQVYQMDENVIQNTLGITKDDLLTLYQSGRQDLINEANSLLGIEQTTTGQMVDVMGTGQRADVASQIAALNRQQQFYNSLIGAGGTMMGKGAS
jgi:hypothetical protein